MRTTGGPVLVFVLMMSWGCDDSPSTPTGPTAAPVLTNFANTTIDGVRGEVKDTLGRRVSDALVEIGDGPLAGRTAMTGADGRFLFPAQLRPTDAMTLRVTHQRFAPASAQWRGRNDIFITLTALQLLDLGGLVTVTMTAAPSCSQLPVPLRTRTYNAQMRPTTNVFTAFTGELGGADFFPAYDTFWTGVGHDAARFHVFSWDAFTWWLEDRPIIERIGPNGFLSFEGIADAPLVQSPTAITAQFDGTITFCSALTPPVLAQWIPTCGAPVACRSDRHEFRMIRR